MNLLHNKLFLDYRVELRLHFGIPDKKTAKGASEIRIFMYPIRTDLVRITNHANVTGIDGFAL